MLRKNLIGFLLLSILVVAFVSTASAIRRSTDRAIPGAATTKIEDPAGSVRVNVLKADGTPAAPIEHAGMSSGDRTVFLVYAYSIDNRGDMMRLEGKVETNSAGVVYFNKLDKISNKINSLTKGITYYFLAREAYVHPDGVEEVIVDPQYTPNARELFISATSPNYIALQLTTHL